MDQPCIHNNILNCYECYSQGSYVPTPEQILNHSVTVWSNPAAIKEDRTKHLMAVEIIRLRQQLSKKETV